METINTINDKDIINKNEKIELGNDVKDLISILNEELNNNFKNTENVFKSKKKYFLK